MAAEEVIKQCIFCQMCMGRASSFKIYEDAQCMAILDIRPANPGHLLVMPKEHYSILPQVPTPLIDHLFLIVQKLSKVAIQSLGARGTNIIIANGLAAGQRAQHVMVHVIPRAEHDGVSFMIPQKDHSEDDLRSMHVSLKKKIAALLGKAQPVEEFPKAGNAPMQSEPVEAPRELPPSDGGLGAVADLLKPKKKGSALDLDTISKMFGGKNE